MENTVPRQRKFVTPREIQWLFRMKSRLKASDRCGGVPWAQSQGTKRARKTTPTALMIVRYRARRAGVSCSARVHPSARPSHTIEIQGHGANSNKKMRPRVEAAGSQAVT